LSGFLGEGQISTMSNNNTSIENAVPAASDTPLISTDTTISEDAYFPTERKSSGKNFRLIRGSMSSKYHSSGFVPGDVLSREDIEESGVGLQRAMSLGVVVETTESRRVFAEEDLEGAVLISANNILAPNTEPIESDVKKSDLPPGLGGTFEEPKRVKRGRNR
jgi:hypothetical protein